MFAFQKHLENLIFQCILSGPYLVFLASTVSGYEGTGRSLSLKLMQQLREQAAGLLKSENEQMLTAVKGFFSQFTFWRSIIKLGAFNFIFASLNWVFFRAYIT